MHSAVVAFSTRPFYKHFLHIRRVCHLIGIIRCGGNNDIRRRTRAIHFMPITLTLFTPILVWFDKSLLNRMAQEIMHGLFSGLVEYKFGFNQILLQVAVAFMLRRI